MASAVDFTLYLITDRHQARAGNLADLVEEALQGGVRAVQLREKDLQPAELYGLASQLRRITAAHGAKLLINDRIDVALAVNADGVHLPERGIPAAAARKIVGPDRLIGVSCHSMASATRAQRDGADFITFGPVFFTPSKAGYGDPLGVARLAETAGSLQIPVFGLGGITTEKIPQVMAAGVRGIALISAIMAAEDPQSAAAGILRTIGQKEP